jgi:hypothetical protein
MMRPGKVLIFLAAVRMTGPANGPFQFLVAVPDSVRCRLVARSSRA